MELDGGDIAGRPSCVKTCEKHHRYTVISVHVKNVRLTMIVRDHSFPRQLLPNSAAQCGKLATRRS